MAGNTPVQGELCPQVWASIGLISLLINMARIKSNECSSRVLKIYETYIKDKNKLRITYHHYVAVLPTSVQTGSGVAWKVLQRQEQ